MTAPAADEAPPLQAHDLALWRYLQHRRVPVTVLADGSPPAWVDKLPRLHGVLAADDAAGAAALPRGVVVTFVPPAALPAPVLAALRANGNELVHLEGTSWRALHGRPARAPGPLRRWLLRRLPRLTGQFGRLLLQRPFRGDGGLCRWASIALLRRPAADGNRELCLFEDGRPLPRPDSLHDDIRTHGRGRYSIWENGVYFASSDGTDPEHNGRAYEVRAVTRQDPRALATPYADEEAFAQAFLAAAAARSPSAPGTTHGRRVLLAISSLGPGGAERQFCYLARGLRRRGCSVGLLSLDGFAGAAGHYLPLLAGSGVELVDALRPSPAFDPGALAVRGPRAALDLLGGMPDIFRADAWRLATHVAAFAPDVLHCALDKVNLLGTVTGVCLGVPRIVLSMRNVNPTWFPYLDVPWFRRWYKLAAQVPGLVLSANSHAGAADYARWLDLPASRVRVVHNGLDGAAVPVPDDAAVAALRAGLGIADGDPVLAGVFRLSAEKRPSLWLQTVAALRSRWPRLRALHVGHGPLHDEVVAEIRRLDLQDTVHLLGRRDDPATVLRAADALLLVSTFEGIPNVALEAQWLGRPVVCTAAGGSVEAVQDGVTGRVVAAAEAAPLAAACAEVLADPVLRARLGAAGHDLVATRFAVDRMVDGSAALYD